MNHQDQKALTDWSLHRSNTTIQDAIVHLKLLLNERQDKYEGNGVDLITDLMHFGGYNEPDGEPLFQKVINKFVGLQALQLERLAGVQPSFGWLDKFDKVVSELRHAIYAVQKEHRNLQLGKYENAGDKADATADFMGRIF